MNPLLSFSKGFKFISKIPTKASLVLRAYLEKKQGIDLTEPVSPSKLGLDPNLVNRYSPSGGKHLRAVLSSLPITTKDVIVDVGCGKGSSMRTMAEFAFSRVEGIEISEELVKIARKNFSKLGLMNCNVIWADANEFKDYDPYTYVYFFNPFPASVVRKVFSYLIDSLKRRPRPMTIIYSHCEYTEIILEGGVFRKVASFPDQWGDSFDVFENATVL